MATQKISYTDPITFRFPAEEFRELAARARREGMGVNQYARTLVLKELRKEEGEK